MCMLFQITYVLKYILCAYLTAVIICRHSLCEIPKSDLSKLKPVIQQEKRDIPQGELYISDDIPLFHLDLCRFMYRIQFFPAIS